MVSAHSAGNAPASLADTATHNQTASVAEPKASVSSAAPISAEWLASVGFKWHQLERQPEKHWLLWLGPANRGFSAAEDLGIELAPVTAGSNGEWYCWFRSDSAGRYSRFIHLRHLSAQAEVIQLFEALTGRPWRPEHHLYGVAHSPESAASLRRLDERLDRQWLHSHPRWRECEKDDTQGGALPEHLDAYPAQEGAPR